MKAVSLFSGCGGLDLGVQQAGFRILLATDADERCEASYRANFGDHAFIRTPIESVTETLLHEKLGEHVHDIDLLVGGPPCPPYSKSRFYRKEKPRGVADEVGDVTLSGYLRILEWLRPRAFLLENVAGFAYDVHKAGLDRLQQTAHRLGYSASYQVLNAADYGVPQIRERFFFVGIRGGSRFQFPEPTHVSPKNVDLLASALPPWRTAGEVLSDLDNDDDDAGHRAGGKHADLLKLVPPGDNYLFFTLERGHPEPVFRWRSRYWSFLLKLSPDLPSWTIQARRSNNMGPFHWKNRILRIPEVCRLQSFPDGWQLAGNVDQQWRQVGNAVPPPLAKALVQAIRKQLEGVDGQIGSRRRQGSTIEEAPKHERVLTGRNR